MTHTEIELALCVCKIYEAILENDDSNLAELAEKLRAAVLACIGNILADENGKKHYLDDDILASLGGMVYQSCRFPWHSKGRFSLKKTPVANLDKTRLEIVSKMRDYMLISLETRIDNEFKDDEAWRIFIKQIVNLDRCSVLDILCAPGVYTVNGSQLQVNDKMAELYRELRIRNPRVIILLVIIAITFVCVMFVLLD